MVYIKEEEAKRKVCPSLVTNDRPVRNCLCIGRECISWVTKDEDYGTVGEYSTSGRCAKNRSK